MLIGEFLVKRKADIPGCYILVNYQTRQRVALYVEDIRNSHPYRAACQTFEIIRTHTTKHLTVSIDSLADFYAALQLVIERN